MSVEKWIRGGVGQWRRWLSWKKSFSERFEGWGICCRLGGLPRSIASDVLVIRGDKTNFATKNCTTVELLWNLSRGNEDRGRQWWAVINESKRRSWDITKASPVCMCDLKQYVTCKTIKTNVYKGWAWDATLTEVISRRICVLGLRLLSGHFPSC